MFQFSGFALLSEYCVFNTVGCPIRISADQLVCADPRSFSQLITSFFASESLGIPHTPFFCLLYLLVLKRCARLRNCAFYFVCINLSQYVNERFRPPDPQRGKAVPPVFPLPFWGGRQGLVENIGVEPMTSCVQGRRSSQLS
jgi:hypothetical protein